MAGRKRRRISLGTTVMLVLTALVLLGCVLFLWLLVGDNLYERTEAFIRTLAQEGLLDDSAGFELASRKRRLHLLRRLRRRQRPCQSR